ncbi:mucin-2 [Culicoides brevitarsis]|uniref:mucin-2 n=1 Tax=Culicoides brevitarsis TaxID=469753 RepID=UPI00307C3415
MRKRKTKDSKMFLSSKKWLTSHCGIYILILMTAFVVNANGSDVAEKPLIIENYKLPSSTSTTLTPVENKTSRSLESSVNHRENHATTRDKSLDVTTISSMDDSEEDDVASEEIGVTSDVPTTVVRTTTTEKMSTKKLKSTKVAMKSQPTTTEMPEITTEMEMKATTTEIPPTTKSEMEKLQSTRTSKAIKFQKSTVESTSPASSSTPLRQRSYDIGVNKTNDIHPQYRTEKNSVTISDAMSGADVLAFANAENAFSSNKTHEALMNANDTLKSLTDWSHIIQAVESTTENIATVPPFSPLPTTSVTRNPVKSSPMTTESPLTTIFKQNMLTIGEVYRKKSESSQVKPQERIDVYKYYQTETPLPPTTTTTTEEALTSTTIWMTTTNADKKNTDAEFIETTLVETTTEPQPFSSTFSRRANYRFTTLPPSTLTDFFSTITTMEPTTTTERVTTTTSTTTTTPSTTTFQEPSTTPSTTTSSTTPSTTSTTTEEIKTDFYTIIPKTSSNFITTQTVVTDNDNIWVVTDENTTPISSTTTSTSTNPSTMSEEVGSTEAPGPDVAAIVVISLSVVGVIAFLLLMGFIFIIRKRQNQTKYANRCRPVGLDAYSLDNVSVYNSVRRKGNNLRLSKRSYGNSAFEDPNLESHVLSVPDLATFVQKKYEIYDEYKDIPVITSRIEEMLYGCEDKNRYSNVIPLPETRVHLKRQNDDEKTEYINANYVKGPDDATNYYIATQAPLDNTIHDFWRMVWEQQSKVIIMATDLSENGVEKCAQYLPSSVVLDNVQTYGQFQVTLKSREVKGEYALSTIHLKHLETKSFREIVHFWYSWPESGVPQDETSLIAMLLEARSYSRLSLPEQRTTDEIENYKTNNNNGDVESGMIESNGKTATSTFDSKTRSLQRTQTPIIVHCSPGTSRTGTIIACDIVLRTLEIPPRQIDIPKIVYTVRRGRANAVQTKQQYEFIYKVAHVYATKLNGPSID